MGKKYLVEGKGTVAVHIAQYCFKKFNEDDTSFEYDEIPGCPLIVDDSVAIRKAVETMNPPTSTRILSDIHGISQTSVVRTLHAHGKKFHMNLQKIKF